MQFVRVLRLHRGQHLTAGFEACDLDVFFAVVRASENDRSLDLVNTLLLNSLDQILLSGARPRLAKSVAFAQAAMSHQFGVTVSRCCLRQSGQPAGVLLSVKRSRCPQAACRHSRSPQCHWEWTGRDGVSHSSLRLQRDHWQRKLLSQGHSSQEVPRWLLRPRRSNSRPHILAGSGLRVASLPNNLLVAL